jgi:hypothetical protein
LAVLTLPDFACAEEVSWDCLADQSSSGAIGLPSLDSAVGALALGHAFGGLVGRNDIGIDALNEPALGGNLQGLLASGGANPKPMSDQVDRMLTQRGSFDAVIATDDRAQVAAATKQGRSYELQRRLLAPRATLGVVLAPIGRRGGEAAKRLSSGISGETVRDALARAGWNGDPATTSGLVEPDVIYALRKEFSS